VTSSEITAREPQQNPVLIFSITLTQKRVCPPVWIILVLYAELASVKTLLRQRPLSLQPPIHSRTCVRCSFPVACTHTSSIRKIQMKIITNTYRRRAHAHTHTHTINDIKCGENCIKIRGHNPGHKPHRQFLRTRLLGARICGAMMAFGRHTIQ